MADLFQGQTMTESYQFVSGGTAHVFQFNFQPDKVVFHNLSQWTAMRVSTTAPSTRWTLAQEHASFRTHRN